MAGDLPVLELGAGPRQVEVAGDAREVVAFHAGKRVASAKPVILQYDRAFDSAFLAAEVEVPDDHVTRVGT